MPLKPSATAKRKLDDLRVLVVSHGHPGLSLGGAEVASHNLHKGLNTQDGVHSFYMARVGQPFPRHNASALMSYRDASDEILYHADDYDHFLLSNRNTDDIRRDLQRFACTLQPDVVHFHHFIGLGLEALHAVREALPEAAIVVTFHEFLPICHHHGQMVKTAGTKLCNEASPISCHGCFPEISPAAFLRRERFVQSMLQIADHFISPSRFLAERYVAWGLAGERMTVIENGLDIAAAAEARQLKSSGDRRSRFAFFGQMTPYKGADVLLDAIGRIPESVWGEDARLMIYGGNLERQPEAYQKKVADCIEKAGNRARFYGSYQNAEMPRLMGSADWVIMPSVWWENSPIVIQEAFFHGRPIISSNIGGMAEKITDGRDGMHFRVGSAEDLADKMIDALTEPDLWERLRQGIRHPITHIECAEAHLRLYRTLVKGAGSGSASTGETMARTA